MQYSAQFIAVVSRGWLGRGGVGSGIAVHQCSESLQCISAVRFIGAIYSAQWLEEAGLEEQGLGAGLVGYCSALAQCTSAVHECNIRSLEEQGVGSGIGVECTSAMF